MSERANRFALGFCLIGFLFLEWNYGVYAIIFVLVFEAITNLRIATFLPGVQFATDGLTPDTAPTEIFKYNYEAERITRFTVATTICLGFVAYSELLWFLPYFVGLNLLLAGVTGLCPLVMFYKKIGFK